MKQEAMANGIKAANVIAMAEAWKPLLAEDPNDRTVRALYLVSKDIVRAINGLATSVDTLVLLANGQAGQKPEDQE